MLREIRRGGQVYFVHNRVEDIDEIAGKVEDIVPEAELRVAHGQMRERELEQVMLDFYNRRFNVLVCTTIIESGIDVPTANTIVINRADRFGPSPSFTSSAAGSGAPTSGPTHTCSPRTAGR